jgi:glucose-1-phosphatase
VIRAFLFDLGNVLVHFSTERMCRQVSDVCGCSQQRAHELMFDSGLLADLEVNRISEEEAYRRFTEMLGSTVHRASLELAASDIFELNEPMVPILDALKADGHRLVLLSNTSITHFRWVDQRFEVLKLFDGFVTSYEVGTAKPAPAIYEAALKQVECAPNECFYADDLEENILAGRRHGLHAEIYTDAATFIEQLKPHGIELNHRG